ncbi:hypothetical protein GCM10023321_14130 [Pseudonocardia eucalypti]|uniref:Uncharacterized protein n=1 Tax=Pseudonocardia eucalypti TaxID=648755 RepID=A0ABP9PP53_9PSEU|nr:hypothetical protein [Pseudonocardia eucalypti]
MSDLTESVIAAYGGLARWNELSEVRAHLLVGGVLWGLKEQDGVINDCRVRVDLHRQFTSHYAFADGVRTAVTPERAAIETEDGQVVAERANPRAAFDGHTAETPWDQLHLAYFGGYAMWNYLTTPFTFAQSDYRTAQLEPWEENGEVWQRLRVTFPQRVATHCPTQVFHFGDDGLLRRHDYQSEVIGWGPAAHYVAGYGEFDGIQVPTWRRVYPLDGSGAVDRSTVLVSIDLDDISFG